MTSTTLGPYDLGEPLGEGGMGVVYRAEDRRLGRQVAVKVLPEGFAGDEERRARFEREAQLVARLNHPNVCALYDVGHEDGRDFLVMELIEGETLDERIRGGLEVDEAIDLASQIAEALEAAHAADIVHRDLKPANVRITPDGQVKVLDFGLAKARAGAAVTSPDFTRSPTIPDHVTRAGMILGTPAYMSPEQARGQDADARADVWAWGVLLFEMLAGERLFRGATVSDTMAAVLREDLDFSRLPEDTPARVRRVLRRCLERDPRQRLHSIADARIELRDRAADVAEQAAAAAGPAASTGGPWAVALPWTLAALAVGLALRLWLVGEEPAAPVQRTVATIPLPAGTSVDMVSPPSISPDGRKVVIGARSADGTLQLWLYSLDDGSTQVIPGTTDGSRAFWSPGSDAIGFFTPTELALIRFEEGVRSVVTEVWGNRYSGAWGPDDDIVFAHEAGLFRVAAGGGPVRPVSYVESGAGGGNEILALSRSPDGGHYAYVVRDYRASAPENEIRIASWSDDVARPVLASNAGAVLAPSGDLVWWDEGHLWAQPLDLDELELVGQRRLLQREVEFDPSQALAMFSIGGDGTLVFRPGSVVQSDELTLVDRQGRDLRRIGPAGNYYRPRFSPDGRQIALDKSDEANRGDIWLFDTERGTGTRLTSAPHDESSPVWSPDGRELVFFSTRSGPEALHRRSLDGNSDEEILLGGPDEKFSPSSWSRTGWISLTRERVTDGGSGDKGDVLAFSPERNETVPVATTPHNEREPRFSPDGRYVAYVSDETGQREVYLQTFPVPSARTRVSAAGGVTPVWRADGREIFYLNSRSEVVSVPLLGVSEEGLPGLGEAEVLFQSEFKSDVGWSPLDTIDGQTFLLNRRRGPRERGPVSLVLHALSATR